jgi:hypothetical protein
MKKVQTHRYSLKYKKLTMQIGQVCVKFFLLKINRLFLIRDAKFEMNKKKIKIRRIQNFRHHFFQEKLKIKLIFGSILKNNSNYINFKDNYCEKHLSFPNYVYLKIELSLKNAILHFFTRKKYHTCRDSRLTECVKSFGQLYIL